MPRAEFVPPELAGRAYVDQPLPIGHGQVTTQPSLVARMVEALALEGGGRLLEIGTGFGWQTRFSHDSQNRSGASSAGRILAEARSAGSAAAILLLGGAGVTAIARRRRVRLAS